MPQPQTFGRRAAPAGPPPAGPPPAAPPLAAPGADTPAEAAEYFRQDLAQVQRIDAAFASWRRDEQARRLHVWFLRVAFLAPGLLVAGLGAPLWATLLLEAAGFAASVWFRTERKNHLRAIASWEAGPGAPGEPS